MKLCILGNSFNYEMEKLVRIFFPFEKIDIVNEMIEDERYAVGELKELDGRYIVRALVSLNGKCVEREALVTVEDEDEEKSCERSLAVELFFCFTELTGYIPDWGILTGVRPAKLFSRLSAKYAPLIS